MARKQQSQQQWWKVLATWLAIFLVIYGLIKATTLDFNAVDEAAIKNSPLHEGSFREKCPHTIQGNPNATLTIKYFDSPYCPWCKKEEPILIKLVQEKGQLFRMERYDVRYCDRQVRDYKVSGTPTFVFITKGRDADGGNTEITRAGYQEESQVTEILCRMSGGC